jgi:CRISPR-associated protein Cmr1
MPKPSDIPVCPVAPPTRSSDRLSRDYRISLVTPLFGGGVDAGEPDESLPIRGTSIRGQLQFWWRATKGAALATRTDLFSHHAAVWGTTERASPVNIEVCEWTAARRKPCATYAAGIGGKLNLRWERPFVGALPYALFPFQGRLDRQTVLEAPAQFIEGVSFTLRVRCPQELLQDVETAVRAWVNFGGLGARTRRGCGTLLCTNLAPRDVTDLPQWFRTGGFPIADKVRDWPTMPLGLLVGDKPQEPVAAWNKVIGLLKEFRQGVGIGRNPGQQHNRPGRSRYPEPETIRRVTNRRSPQHGRLGHVPDDAFPRAEFGLPIVFHFPPNQGEPLDTTLYPGRASDGEPRERMASPLVLKPLAMADGKAVPLILRLVTPALTAVELRQGNEPLPLPKTVAIRGSRLAQYRDPDSPIKDSASGSAIEAFGNHARQNGFREVTR